MPEIDDSTFEDDELVRTRIEQLLTDFDPTKLDEKEFWGRQYDLGLAWVHFPVGLGGLSVSPSYIETIANALSDVGAPSNFLLNPIGIGMGAPTLLTHGLPETTSSLLRPLFTCDQIWCQLFSEPGAGSDVASISTKAIKDGDYWVVRGQKVWTTLAHVSKWGMLLARTDTTAPLHAGLTYFMLDMEAAGVEVRPLRQITGDAEFNEVYLNDVYIPDQHRLGEIGAGWKVALTTLMNERVSLGMTIEKRGGGAIGDAVKLWKSTSSHHQESDKDTLLKLWTRAEVNRITNIRATQARQSGTPGPEGSVAKLASAELNKQIYNFCENMQGAKGVLYRSYEMTRPSHVGLSAPGSAHDLTKMFLRSRASSIEGGTSEIMKNILGERILGLPGEPRSMDRSSEKPVLN